MEYRRVLFGYKERLCERKEHVTDYDLEVGGLYSQGEDGIRVKLGAGVQPLPLPLVEPLDVLEGVLEDLADRQGAAFEPALGQPEDLPLGVVDECLHVLLGLERLTDDLRRGLDELAKDGHVAHDAGVCREVGGDRGVLDEESERPGTADGFQRAITPEVLAQCDEIDGLAAVEQALHRCVDRSVRVGVEVGRPEQLDDAGQSLTAFEQNSAEDGSFRIEVVRWDS